MINFDDLWKLEQELITCLDEIKTIATKIEGSRKISWNDSGQNRQNTDQSLPQRPLIILPGINDNLFPQSNNVAQNFGGQRNRQQQFMGGSLGARISYADGDTMGYRQGNASVDGMQKNKLANEDNLLSLFAMANKKREAAGGNTSSLSENEELHKLRLQAHKLSCCIFDKRQAMGLKLWLCDQTSAKDINVKMGGDGTFKDNNGGIVLMPDTPLSKNCLGRKGQVGANLWIMECVLCPVNYIDSDDRLAIWQKHFEARKEARIGDKDGQNNQVEGDKIKE